MSLRDQYERIQRAKVQPRKPMSLYDEDCALVARLCDLRDEDVLSDWEVGFADDLHERVIEKKNTLTDPQRDKVEEILGAKE
jgi:hypothetical protein